VIPRILKALFVGACCAALGISIHCWLWDQPFPYYDYGSQAFATAHPEQGFSDWSRDSSQPFFWQEILDSRDFQLAVLREKGVKPKNLWGSLPQVSAAEVTPHGTHKPGTFYVTMSFPMSPYPAEKFRSAFVQEFIPVTKAFVEAVRVRGVVIAPVGDVELYTKEISSWRTVLKYNWSHYLLLGCVTAALVEMLSRRNYSLRKLQTTVG